MVTESDIRIRDLSEILTRDFLLQKYVNEHKSTYKIADEVGCDPSTVWDYLNKFRIKTRKATDQISKLEDIEKSELMMMYWVEGKTINQIASELKVSRETLHRRMRKLKIPTRNSSYAPSKIDWSEHETFWAYLAGIIDGEGSITIDASIKKTGKLQLKPAISISNTDENLIELLETKLKSRAKITKYTKRWENCHSIYVCRAQDIKLILEKTLPYLIVKKERARLMLSFIKSRIHRKGSYTKRELEISLKLMKLNSTKETKAKKRVRMFLS